MNPDHSQKLLDDILAFRKDLELNDINLPPNLAGMFGEIVAWRELDKIFTPKGYKVDFGSGQSKADIQLRKDSKVINVEIKTSRLKKEWYGTGYGFAINIKKCKNHLDKILEHPRRGKLAGDFCYLDYIVAVLLSNDLSEYKFYVFPKSFLEEHEQDLRNRNKRFSSSTHRMIFIEQAIDTNEITDVDRDLAINKKKYENAWNIIG